MQEQLFTTTKVAKIFGVTPRTIQMWADSGTIQVAKTVGGHRRITAEEVDRLSRELGKAKDEETSREATDSARNTERPAGDLVRVMIVDDDKDLLKLYQTQIENWQTPKTEVFLCHDGYDALLQIGSKKPDIIIIDLLMPRMDGAHLIKIIQQNTDMEHCQIVVVTGLNEEEIHQSYALPDNVLVEEKPIPFARIQRLVNEHMNTKL